MKIDKDFESKYQNVLRECIALFDEEVRYEKEQIALALKIGERVNRIVDNIEDNDAIFKRISRDIFRARGKLIPPFKISEYRQLYLNFQSMDTVSSMEKSLMSDITIGTLTGIALRDDRHGKKAKEDVSPLLTMLKKANRLLDRFEVAMEDNQPDDKDLARILDELKLISGKSETILNSAKKTDGMSQLDLFWAYHNGAVRMNNRD